MSPNKSLQRTGISEPLIENVPPAQLSPGRSSAAFGAIIYFGLFVLQ